MSTTPDVALAPFTARASVIASAGTGKLMCPVADLWAFLDTMVGVPLMTHEYPQAFDAVAGPLMDAHPWLHGLGDAIGETPDDEDAESYWRGVAAALDATRGTELPCTPVPGWSASPLGSLTTIMTERDQPDGAHTEWVDTTDACTARQPYRAPIAPWSRTPRCSKCRYATWHKPGTPEGTWRHVELFS